MLNVRRKALDVESKRPTSIVYRQTKNICKISMICFRQGFSRQSQREPFLFFLADIADEHREDYLADVLCRMRDE